MLAVPWHPAPDSELRRGLTLNGLAPDGSVTTPSVWDGSEVDPKLNGRYWTRTSDPFRVKEVRYRCANRPGNVRSEPALQRS